ncbi:hypothetical protein AB0I35_32155 [Nocardia sp. NPDC050378]|uniref:hypothetical protein n=1 Tax=Nocardia sp. NPDC050378 TaxID=3155400 RepID=UPI0033E95B02
MMGTIFLKDGSGPKSVTVHADRLHTLRERQKAINQELLGKDSCPESVSTSTGEQTPTKTTEFLRASELRDAASVMVHQECAAAGVTAATESRSSPIRDEFR